MSIDELQQFEEEQRLNHSFNSEIYSLNFSTSKIFKSELTKHYLFLCKFCDEVPVIKFIKRNKIKYICKCKLSPKELLIKEIFNYLYHSDEEIMDTSKLKCILHPDEKYNYYCEKCKKNICYKCIQNCIEHENKIKALALDINTINKSKYIITKLEERNKITFEDGINSLDIGEDIFSNQRFPSKKFTNTSNNRKINSGNKEDKSYVIDDYNYKFIEKEKTDKKNDINEKEMINIINENNNDEINEDNYYSLNLFSIIIEDYQNFPNYNHIETISNLEKYISFYFDDYNEIILKYEFDKVSIKSHKVELFGEIFVNNNKEKCFLIINERIMELSRYIYLPEIIENYIIKILIFPIQLDVKLIKPKRKVVNDISFMFYGISTLLPSSDFSEFNTINITKMSYMFYNCLSLKQIPDISKFNTNNVNDMSYMFYNCSSLKLLPDISKFDTSNVSNMSYLFFNCSSLKKLPDISKWNMENIEDINNMFAYCKLLISIPDISNWNINENKIKNINYLFYGCSSLSSLPNILKWNIDKNLFTSNMFERCNIIKKNLKLTNNIKRKFFNHFTNFLDKTFSCLKMGYYIYSIFVFFIFVCLVNFPVYNSFNLVEARFSSKNPYEFFELKNYVNITNIANYYNMTNRALKIEMFENKENFLNYKINFTNINKGIKFESDLKNYKILSVIIGFLSTINLILFSTIFFKDYFDLNFKLNIFYISLILSLLYIIIIILSSITFSITNRLYNSFSDFYSLIENLFQIEISNNIWKEIKFLDKSSLFICVNIIFSILFVASSIGELNNSIEYIKYRSFGILDILVNGK